MSRQGEDDSLAESLTVALAKEYKSVLDSCAVIQDAPHSLADASGQQADEVQQPCTMPPKGFMKPRGVTESVTSPLML
ncbi:hypothetical protein [Streptomyces sp. AC558_RSS880]|uniref:hypothetical protein n=1 Tax=Streptomyces sp. AC558_RSS880 TaxID=2823687 RepID=UPI001C2244CD|nr:hypothetical protein [Streptomyces sp. AC558_RSS880]